MIGKLFTIDGGGHIIPKEVCYIIGPIKEIMDRYPNSYQKIIAYLHFMTSLRPDDNPYADVPLEDRSDQIIYELGLGDDFDPDSDLIQRALISVEEKYYTTFYGLYKGFKSALDKLGKKLLTEEIDLSREGNHMAITRMMEKYESLRKSFKLAYKDFEDEQGDLRVKGGGRLADDEDEDY